MDQQQEIKRLHERINDQQRTIETLYEGFKTVSECLKKIQTDGEAFRDRVLAAFESLTIDKSKMH